jgi:hypothetical protein
MNGPREKYDAEKHSISRLAGVPLHKSSANHYAPGVGVQKAPPGPAQKDAKRA